MEPRLVLSLFLALQLITLHLLPLLSRTDRLFGVPVQPGMRSSIEGRRILWRYQLLLTPWTLGALMSSILLPLSWSAFWIFFASVMPLVGAYLAFSQLHSQARQIALSSSSVRSVALRLDEDAISQKWFFAVPLIALFLCALYLMARWDQIPERFPIHWNGDMVADGWSNRSIPGVFGPLLLGATLILFLASQRKLSAETSRRSARRPAVAATIVISWVLGASCSLVALLPLHSFTLREILSFDVLCFLFAVGTVLASMKNGGGPAIDSSELTPEECWHCNIIYHNSHDPALFVEKRFGPGLTFNFGNRLSWVILPLIISLPLLLAFMALRFTGN